MWKTGCNCVPGWQKDGRRDVNHCSPITCPAYQDWLDCKFRNSLVTSNVFCGKFFTVKFKSDEQLCQGKGMIDKAEAWQTRPHNCELRRPIAPLNHKYYPLCVESLPKAYVTSFVASAAAACTSTPWLFLLVHAAAVVAAAASCGLW